MWSTVSTRPPGGRLVKHPLKVRDKNPGSSFAMDSGPSRLHQRLKVGFPTLEKVMGVKRGTTWMSQEVSKWVVNGLQYNLLINGVYWGYSPLTNLLLTSWDIQVHPLKLTASLPLKIGKLPKRKRESTPTIHFQVQFVSFREGKGCLEGREGAWSI